MATSFTGAGRPTLRKSASAARAVATELSPLETIGEDFISEHMSATPTLPLMDLRRLFGLELRQPLASVFGIVGGNVEASPIATPAHAGILVSKASAIFFAVLTAASTMVVATMDTSAEGTRSTPTSWATSASVSASDKHYLPKQSDEGTTHIGWPPSGLPLGNQTDEQRTRRPSTC